jgi:hypothetical protein
VASSPLNGVVRSLLTSPERCSFKPTRPRTSSNTLISQGFNNRTKMAVVRLRRRKWAERDRKRPEVGLAVAAGGSDNWPEKAAFCGFPTANQEPKKNVPTGRLGGASSQERTVLPDRQGRYREILRDGEPREGSEARRAVGFGTVRQANGVWNRELTGSRVAWDLGGGAGSGSLDCRGRSARPNRRPAERGFADSPFDPVRSAVIEWFTHRNGSDDQAPASRREIARRRGVPLLLLKTSRHAKHRRRGDCGCEANDLGRGAGCGLGVPSRHSISAASRFGAIKR